MHMQHSRTAAVQILDFLIFSWAVAHPTAQSWSLLITAAQSIASQRDW